MTSDEALATLRKEWPGNDDPVLGAEAVTSFFIMSKRHNERHERRLQDMARVLGCDDTEIESSIDSLITTIRVLAKLTGDP